VTGVGRMVDEAGTEHYNINGAVVRVPTKEDEGKGMILGVMVEDFAKQFGLPKPGETATVTVTGPENHEVEALRGKKLTISFAVDRVDRIVPAKVEDLVSRFGFESESQLREAVEQRLSQRAQVVQKSVQHQQIARHLLKETKLDLPPKLTASQAARNLDRRRLELMYRGVDPAAIETHMAELRAASGEQAARDLKLVFILNKAAEELGVEVTEGEVNGRIVAMAMQRNARPDQLRAELIRTGQAGMVVQQVREHKTLDRILQDAEVTEMSVEEFNKAMRDEAGAA
jgi:trigger factor